MNERAKTSGNQAAWLVAVADAIMDGGAMPPSIERLNAIVPDGITTGRNDGHCTAGEQLGEKFRDDYRAGWRIIIDEMVESLRRHGLVGGTDEALIWLAPLDGEWRVPVGHRTITVRGQLERRMARDRHMLGERDENSEEPFADTGMIGAGGGEFNIQVLKPRGGIEWLRDVMVHPLALLVPPMSEAEREALRKDIAEHGVKVPLVLYPDANDVHPKTGKPREKVLDGRSRLYLASGMKVPVRIEHFEGTEDQARSLVASLNLHRRHLFGPQRALTLIRLFGERAKKEAAEAKPGPKRSMRESTSISDAKNGGNVAERIVTLAGGPSPGVPTVDAIRNMLPVMDAPETVADIDAGKVPTVAEAGRRAAAETKRPAPPRGSNGTMRRSVFSRLGQAKKELEILIGDLDVPLGTKPGETIAERLTEIDALLKRIRNALKLRKVI